MTVYAYGQRDIPRRRVLRGAGSWARRRDGAPRRHVVDLFVPPGTIAR